jgi:phosphoglycolate phosphatase-like HAD superfamily hydrolase
MNDNADVESRVQVSTSWDSLEHPREIRNSKPGAVTAMKLLLFDIDGTLMLSGGAGRRAINRTFLELYGITDAFHGIVPDGNTDPLIFSEIMTRHGLPTDHADDRLAELERRYVIHMEDEMRRSPGAHLMPGVRALLERLDNDGRFRLGLLTGNFERTARAKLERFGLERFFQFGAFGSDHAERIRLVPIAVSRAEDRLQSTIGLGRHVVVIGDTPKDVACALAAGVTAVGIAAARYSVAELRAAGAHHALADLEDVDAFMTAVGETCVT